MTAKQLAPALEALPAELLYTKVEQDLEVSCDLLPALAVTFLCRQVPGCRYFVRVSSYAPATDSPDQCFRLSGCVRVPKAQALKVVRDLWGGRFAKEALVPVTVLGACVFVG